MDEQKHYQYEGHDPVFPKAEVEVTEVDFMTPALVHLGENKVPVQIDLVKRKAYDSDGKSVDYSDQIFEYLDRMNTLPENFFEASEDIYNRAAQATEEAGVSEKKGEL